MLSDAPAHHLFCLLPPVPPTQNALPEVLAVIQVQKRRCPGALNLGTTWVLRVSGSVTAVEAVDCRMYEAGDEGAWKESTTDRTIGPVAHGRVEVSIGSS